MIQFKRPPGKSAIIILFLLSSVGGSSQDRLYRRENGRMRVSHEFPTNRISEVPTNDKGRVAEQLYDRRSFRTGTINIERNAFNDYRVSRVGKEDSSPIGTTNDRRGVANMERRSFVTLNNVPEFRRNEIQNVGYSEISRTRRDSESRYHLHTSTRDIPDQHFDRRSRSSIPNLESDTRRVMLKRSDQQDKYDVTRMYREISTRSSGEADSRTRDVTEGRRNFHNGRHTFLDNNEATRNSRFVKSENRRVRSTESVQLSRIENIGASSSAGLERTRISTEHLASRTLSNQRRVRASPSHSSDDYRKTERGSGSYEASQRRQNRNTPDTMRRVIKNNYGSYIERNRRTIRLPSARSERFLNSRRENEPRVLDLSREDSRFSSTTKSSNRRYGHASENNIYITRRVRDALESSRARDVPNRVRGHNFNSKRDADKSAIQHRDKLTVNIPHKRFESSKTDELRYRIHIADTHRIIQNPSLIRSGQRSSTRRNLGDDREKVLNSEPNRQNRVSREAVGYRIHSSETCQTSKCKFGTIENVPRSFRTNSILPRSDSTRQGIYATGENNYGKVDQSTSSFNSSAPSMGKFRDIRNLEERTVSNIAYLQTSEERQDNKDSNIWINTLQIILATYLLGQMFVNSEKSKIRYQYMPSFVAGCIKERVH